VSQFKLDLGFGYKALAGAWIFAKFWEEELDGHVFLQNGVGGFVQPGHPTLSSFVLDSVVFFDDLATERSAPFGIMFHLFDCSHPLSYALKCSPFDFCPVVEPLLAVCLWVFHFLLNQLVVVLVLVFFGCDIFGGVPLFLVFSRFEKHYIF
jgi:hypothetical protein